MSKFNRTESEDNPGTPTTKVTFPKQLNLTFGPSKRTNFCGHIEVLDYDRD